MDNQVSNILKIIKFSPSLIIITAFIFIMSLIYAEHKKEFEEDKKYIENQFIINEKKRIQSNVKNLHDFIKSQKKESEEKLKKNIREKISNAHKIAMNIYIKNKDKKEKKEIIQQIKDSLEVIRFNDERGYFSIHTMEGINILHPINKDFEGTSVLNRKDILGNYPLREALNIVKTKDEGIFTWYWYKPNDKSKEFKKIGIVKKFKPYGLIITTAEYVEDFENNLKKRLLSQIAK